MLQTEKEKYITRASKIWDTLSEREKGRLEGQLDVYEKLAKNKNLVFVEKDN